MRNEPESSPLKNVTEGSGCGCGCLGLLMALAGVMVIGGTWIELYEPSWDTTFWWIGAGSIGTGITASVLGVVVFLGSLFLD